MLEQSCFLYGTDGDDELTFRADDDALFRKDYIANATIYGYDGNDTLIGGSGSDSIYGGKGDDTIRGGNGDDTIYYELGDGNDLIDMGNGRFTYPQRGYNVLVLGEGIMPDEVTVELSSDKYSFILHINKTGESVTMTGNVISGFSNLFPIKEIRFADGTVWTIDNLSANTTTTKSTTATTQTTTTNTTAAATKVTTANATTATTKVTTANATTATTKVTTANTTTATTKVTTANTTTATTKVTTANATTATTKVTTAKTTAATVEITTTTISPTSMTHPAATTTTTTAPATVLTYGDANCDGAVDMADAVLIMQALANPNKYGVNGTNSKHITLEGAANADVDKTSEGLTANDALRIQKYLLHMISNLLKDLA